MIMNNWHRKIWTLQSSIDTNFYRGGASNQFWLEPAAYVGPAVTVTASGGLIPITIDTTYTQNVLCFRVQFLDGAMTDAWRDLLLFATGTAKYVSETPTNDSQRLENFAPVAGPPPQTPVVRIFQVNPASPKLEMFVEYQGGGGGWVHST